MKTQRGKNLTIQTNPAASKQLLEAAWSGLTGETKAAVKKVLCQTTARAFDDPQGFACFFEIVFGYPLAPFALEEWIIPIYESYACGRGIIIEAFRGSTKTTTVSIAFLAFRIGHNPELSNLLIQAGDDSASDTSAQIADIIANNPGWKMVFPHIVPDRAAGWGNSGYEVKRSDMPYSAWRKLCAAAKGKDPTLVGMGYRSRAIIGRHPTGVLLVDDIHDENNTRSRAELEMVSKILTGTILPTAAPQTRKIFIGTPWAQDDVLAYLKATGEFRMIRTPILRDSSTAWPERFPVSEIEKFRRLSGEIEFARMYLLDLESAEGMHLKNEWLREFPAEKIRSEWKVVIGVDYASTVDQLKTSSRDYFAAAVGRIIPGGGGIVLEDGFRGKISQGEAEERLKELALLYPTLQMIGIEAVGKGEEFYSLMLRSSLLPVLPMYTGRQSKGVRFERGMAPLFQMGRAFISSRKTPFLQAFREEWMRFPLAKHDDTLDAVYWMLYTAQSSLWPQSKKAGQKKNPFAQLQGV